MFYFTYGIVFYLCYWKKSKTSLTDLVLSAFLCDLVSNIIEISIMLHFKGYSYVLFQDLALIAFIRSIVNMYNIATEIL